MRDSLVPAGVGSLPQRSKAAQVACGSYHSFVISETGRVIGWGLNNYAELGLPDEAGSDGGNILKPALVDALADYDIAQIAGGEHHSLARPRMESSYLGPHRRQPGWIWRRRPLPRTTRSMMSTESREFSRFRLSCPTFRRSCTSPLATDHSFAVGDNGKVYSWGFSANYQTGQGTTDDIEVPTLIDNSAIREKVITWAGAGGQYSILAALKEGGSLEGHQVTASTRSRLNSRPVQGGGPSA